jgi:ubiquinone/menaquinone biosynthesis C-methylase UbiE
MREGMPDVEFLEGDVEWMPYREASYDMIICLGVLAYLDSEQKVLGEFARILKPGGTMIVSTVNKFRLVKRLDLPVFVRDRLRSPFIDKARIEEGRSGGRGDGANVNTYSIAKFRKSLELAGFRILEYTTVPLEVLTMFGREILPKRMAIRMAEAIDSLSNIPIVGSFGGMCLFRVRKEH